jgi:glycerate kinase
VGDGGPGFGDLMAGTLRTTTVRGPLGSPVEAAWRLDGRTAAIEMASASGLDLVGGAARNDPIRADTAGTGELIAAAVNMGARRVFIGSGGSAGTDGGLAAIRVLEPISRLRGVELVAACDDRALFVEAARKFAPRKGASPTEVELLVRRLERLIQVYHHEFGIDVSGLEGAGSGGGLAGGLAAIGASLLPGFDVIADITELGAEIEEADLVITGEAALESSAPAAGSPPDAAGGLFSATPVGRVVALANTASVNVLVLTAEPDESQGIRHVSMVQSFGRARVEADPVGCIEELVAAELAKLV